MRSTGQHWMGRLRSAVGAEWSFATSLAIAIGGLLVLAIVALALGGAGLLKEQAEEQVLARVQLAGVSARDELRRNSEEALTTARLLAGRPTLLRLVDSGNPEQLDFFLRRFCETSRFDACAVVIGDTVLAAVGPIRWDELNGPVSEQGERFLAATPSAPDGVLGAAAELTTRPGARAVVLRYFDRRLAAALAERAGAEIRLVRLSDWLETVEPAFKELHAAAVANGKTMAALVESAGVYASSTPVAAVTGEGVALIEARLPVATVQQAVDRFVTRLLVTASVLATLALLTSWLLARRIGAPLESLARAARTLGRGDFSTAIPASGSAEVAALARTMDDMRRNLIDLTTTLRSREAEAQALLQGVVEGVFAVDGDRRIRYLNRQAAHMLGVDAAAAVGSFCGDVLRPCAANDGSRPCESACPIVTARESGKVQATELLQRADGSRRVVVVTSAAPVDGMQVQVMRDETELEAVRRARDSILANISHEFRTPLAAQQASIELLRDGLAEMPREQLEELVASLQRGTVRLTRLIDNLLESVRIESGQLAIRRQPVELAQVIEDAQELVQGLLVQRRQRLHVALPADLPVIQGDAQRLTQVFTNLLANANKFGPESSEICIGGAVDTGEVTLWVEDEGPGVPEPAGASIFERFYRSADQEPEPRGLGLGLWIVKSIVDRHGGRVAAGRTTAGRTRFSITLPVGMEAS
ncbi:MAG: ATP-binding protein [Steroidobacteraceae bacterium]|nr:ATP-binding protein [Steroidobacteraceae bacterium]